MTTYAVTAERGEGRVWVFQCVEVPGAISESRRLADASALMREAISFVADVDPGAIEITLLPQLDDDLSREVIQAREAVASLAKRQHETAALSRAAARHLVDAGLTGTDAAIILGLSPQRVSQLVSAAKQTPAR